MNQLIKEFNEAKEDLVIAEQNMNMADPDYLDVAIAEYNAKKAKLDVLLQRIKQGGVEMRESNEKKFDWKTIWW